MPLVRVRYKDTVPNAVLDGLGALLSDTVAKRLSCGDAEGQLTPGDIEVQFDAASPRDFMSFELSIDVEAMNFPTRHHGDPESDEPHFKTRVLRIKQDLERGIPVGRTFGLWVKLNNAQWQEGEGTGRPLERFMSGM